MFQCECDLNGIHEKFMKENKSDKASLNSTEKMLDLYEPKLNRYIMNTYLFYLWHWGQCWHVDGSCVSGRSTKFGLCEEI